MAEASTGRPSQNRLLAALTGVGPPGAVNAEIVNLESGQVLADGSAASATVYFPLSSILSLNSVLSDGRSVVFATVGREGMTGVPELLSERSVPLRTTVQVGGAAARVSAAEVRDLAWRSRAALLLLLRYNRALFVHCAQAAACNHAHSVEQRAARWLLMTHDRLGRHEFLLTQEFLSRLLGVRRARVNAAAGALQRSGVIQYSRGRLRIVDRPRLEGAACECYDVIRGEYDQLAQGAGEAGAAEGAAGAGVV